MKAVVLNRLGDFDSLVDAEVRDLKVSADEILVKTRAVAVDPIDIKIGSGSRGGRDGMILGSSVAGDVVAVGRNVRGFKVGDRLAANVRGGETYAEE
ncbi:alcohol dehydrogenase catalytic domain-containing protein, partial [Weissella sp. DD23]